MKTCGLKKRNWNISEHLWSGSSRNILRASFLNQFQIYGGLSWTIFTCDFVEQNILINVDRSWKNTFPTIYFICIFSGTKFTWIFAEPIVRVSLRNKFYIDIYVLSADLPYTNFTWIFPEQIVCRFSWPNLSWIFSKQIVSWTFCAARTIHILRDTHMLCIIYTLP